MFFSTIVIEVLLSEMLALSNEYRIIIGNYNDCRINGIISELELSAKNKT